MSTDSKNLFVLGVSGVIVAVVVGLVIGAFIIYKVYRLYNPYLDREISGPITLTNEWVEIEFKEPLFPERPKNEICIDFENTYPDHHVGLGMILPDGQLLSPEIQLVDLQGNAFILNEVTAMGPRGFNRGMRDPETFRETLPRDRSYRAIRVRSDTKVNVSRIFWRSYDPKDFK